MHPLLMSMLYGHIPSPKNSGLRLTTSEGSPAQLLGKYVGSVRSGITSLFMCWSQSAKSGVHTVEDDKEDKSCHTFPLQLQIHYILR